MIFSWSKQNHVHQNDLADVTHNIPMDSDPALPTDVIAMQPKKSNELDLF
jgi:hypothetical protein